MATDLTKEAQAGQRAEIYGDALTPHIFSSPAWLGFMAGRQLVDNSAIVKAAMSRGLSVRLETCLGAKFIIKFKGEGLEEIDVEPIA